MRAIMIAALLLAATEAWAETGEDRLFKRILMLESHPCESGLYMRRLFAGEWYLTCKTCAAIPAAKVFSPDLIRDMEAHELDGHIYLNYVQAMFGECPSGDWLKGGWGKDK